MNMQLWFWVEALQNGVLLGMVLGIYFLYRNYRIQAQKRFKEEVEKRTQELRFEWMTEIDKMKDRVEHLEARGNKSVELFKTVLHGFDFIVQGCKKAIDSGEEVKDILKTETVNLVQEQTEGFLEGSSDKQEKSLKEEEILA